MLRFGLTTRGSGIGSFLHVSSIGIGVLDLPPLVGDIAVVDRDDVFSQRWTITETGEQVGFDLDDGGTCRVDNHWLGDGRRNDRFGSSDRWYHRSCCCRRVKGTIRAVGH